MLKKKEKTRTKKFFKFNSKKKKHSTKPRIQISSLFVAIKLKC